MFQLRLLGEILCNGDIGTIIEFLSKHHPINDNERKRICSEIYSCQEEDFIIVDDTMYIIQRIIKKKMILP